MKSDRQERRGWSVARILRDGYAHLRFRKSVLRDRVLTISMDGIMASSGGLAGYLASLDAVPGCGDQQRESIQAALIAEFRAQAEMSSRAGDMVLAQRLAHQVETLVPVGDTAGDTAVVQFHRAAALEAVCARMWQDMPTQRFIYLPETLPDQSKTAAVMACEGLAAAAVIGPSFWAQVPESTAPSHQPQGLILIDGEIIGAIRARCGRYAALSEAAWQEQKSKLVAFCAALPAGVVVKVADFAGAKLTAGAILGSSLVLPVPGGSVCLSQAGWLPDIIAACELAQDDAQDLPGLLAV
ncbi:hypothetical protein [Roseicyclus sp.]|uniref:hypothetical protein n=1 Tax=Roseicyclus sp. TaxID=1914329 RepID=UPI003F6CA8D0